MRNGLTSKMKIFLGKASYNVWYAYDIQQITLIYQVTYHVTQYYIMVQNF